MAYQTGRQILVAYQEEDAFGEAATTAGAYVFRPNTGSLNLDKTPIQSNENRRDGMMTRGRHGMRNVQGQYEADLSVGGYDDLFEALFRGTWQASLTIDESTSAMASATLAIGANTITASAGSWITAGLRVGDVIRETSGTTAANMNRNLRITGLTATVITVAETLTVEAGPIATYDIVRPKKLIQGTTSRSFTFEEYELDIDGTELFKGVRVGSGGLVLQPNAMTIARFGCVGQDMEVLTGGSAPYFASPTASTGLGLTAVEAVIRLGSSDVLDLTALELGIDLSAAGQPVVGSVLTPDVFTNLANVTLNLTALREDLSRVTQFLDETELSLHVLFAENESEPKDFVSLYVPNITLGSSAKSPLGQDGARTQQFTALVGIDERGGAYDTTMVKLQTSAA